MGASLGSALDRIAEARSGSHDRAVDLLRLAAVGVVVVWHWVFSVTHRLGDVLVNPNPIDTVPGGWVLTWGFQVVPLFFLIGGYANLAAWDRVHGSARRFLRWRLRRVLGPALVFVAVWALVDVLLRLLRPDYPGIVYAAPILITPLWFVLAYAWVLLLVPLTATAHRRYGVAVVVALGTVIVAADVARFWWGAAWAGAVNTALVWVFVHQLGYLWRDQLRRPGWRGWLLAGAALVAMALAVGLGPYPRSMVAVPSGEFSPLFPTTAVVAGLAVFQLGAASLLAVPLAGWLRRRRVWRGIVAGNAVAYTVFLWHMTALLVVFVAAERLGFRPPADPTPTWWLTRPLWLLAPAVALVPLVAAFAPLERRFASPPPGTTDP
ncbi:MAG: acyltransferase family protein [Micromonosporaceae bacterium]